MKVRRRPIFLAAAAYNFLVGLPLLLVPEALVAAMGPGAADVSTMRSLGWCIIVFGIGYVLVARHPGRNDDIIRMGIIGKLGLVVMVGIGWFSGTATTTSLLLTMGDLAFVVLFLMALRRPPNPTGMLTEY